MNLPDLSVLSRRQWLERVSAPALAASLGAGLLGTNSAVAQSGSPSVADDKRGGARVYSVREFGAVGDGSTLDTVAVQAAIDACTADRGGIVLVPAGTFVVGTLELKSNVALRIAAQGRLLGSPRPEDYRAGNGVPPGNGNIVLLSAANAENITVEGPGTIDGNGAKFFTGKGDNTGPGQRTCK
jgi:polygalacturonase